MIIIEINGQLMKIGQHLPKEIYSLRVVYPNGFRVALQEADKKFIKVWFNDLIDALTCSHIEYNGVLIPVEDLNKFEDLS